MTVVLELYDVANSVADVKHLKRTVREVLGGRVILTLVIPTGNSARIAVIRDDEIPLDVLEELRKGGIEARLVLQSPILGISESPEFVRDVLRAYENFGRPGVAAILSGLSPDYIIEKVGHVLPLNVILTLDEEVEKKDLSVMIRVETKPSKKRLIRADGSEEPYDPDKIMASLIKAGISPKIAKSIVSAVEMLVNSDFIIDYELEWAVKRALGSLGDHADVTAYEGYSNFASRVFIDGNEFSVARLMDIIRSAIVFENLEPSPTLLRQLRDYIVGLLKHMASTSTTDIHISSKRISDTARTLLLSQMPYLVSKKPWDEAYFEASRNFMIAQRLLDVDRGEAIRTLEKAIEHSLRTIALATGKIPPLGIRPALVSVKKHLREALVKRLRLLRDLRMPYNRYNLQILNVVLEATDELMRIALEKSVEASSYERDAKDTLS